MYIVVTVNLATYFADHRLDYSQGDIDDITFKVKMFLSARSAEQRFKKRLFLLIIIMIMIIVIILNILLISLNESQ